MPRQTREVGYAEVGRGDAAAQGRERVLPGDEVEAVERRMEWLIGRNLRGDLAPADVDDASEPPQP